MKFLSGRIGVACSLFVWPLLILAAFVTSALAQSPDVVPPVIELDSVAEAYKGDSQVFNVGVTDDQGIGSVVFHYRFDGDGAYINVDMMQIGQSDLYTVAVQDDAISSSVSVIEYYIEALDESGNRTLQGFSFDPLERTLKERPVAIATHNQSVDVPSTSLLDSLSTTQKVIYGVLGVVVVGALISAGGSNDNGSVEPLVPVTIVTDPLDISQ